MSLPTPIFLSGRELVTSSLRLHEHGNTSTALQVSQAIIDAKIYLYDNLPESVINTLLTYANVPNPSTANEIKRAKANKAELLLIKISLLKVAATFILNATQANDVWNENGLTRLTEQSRMSEIDNAQKEVDILLASLSAGEVASPSVVSVIGPEEPNQYPGDVFLGGSDPSFDTPFGS